jgi:transposase-like protein
MMSFHGDHMTKHIRSEIKDQVLLEIKNGTKVVDAAIEYNISDKTIYAWMQQQADNTGTSSLEVAKLRRENQELKEIIGMFALDKKRAEKNTRGA